MLTNTWLGMPWFDHQNDLGSPKSAARDSGIFALYVANYYPLIFGLIPLLSIAFIGSITTLLKKTRIGKIKDMQYVIFASIMFITLYHLGSTASLVGATLRYQISLFPIAMIMTAIGIVMFINKIIDKYTLTKQTSLWLKQLSVTTVIITSLTATFTIAPYYFSYANALLPKQFILNLKDMGDGSYQIAQHLNTLPNAQNLTIWSDKSGVCTFFKGKCESSVNHKKYIQEETIFDYYVVSRTRQSRTTGLVTTRAQSNPKYLLRFDKLYTFKDYEYEILPGGRTQNFIRIIDGKKANDLVCEYMNTKNQ